MLEILARHARSVLGAERCRTLHLETNLDGAQARLEETAEMVRLAECGHPFPALSFPDLREVISRVSKGATLEPHELRDCSIVLGLGMETAAFLGRRREEISALSAAAQGLENLSSLRPLMLAIDHAVDPEGNVRESATPELRRHTHHAKDLKRQIRHRLETILESRRYADVLQERYLAEREGRYVIPVKAEMRSTIPGIVHDVSASGATVFLEPRELVELNNAIKVAELEIQREVRRILQELSGRVADQGGLILETMDVLSRLDCVAAKAVFSQQVKGQAVALNARGRIVLRRARHPLLVLAREQVVANDVVMDETVRVLVISGPNTGGKTVTLKMVGLFSLMVRAGLLLPCAADSEMAVFPDVFADIGDAQDLAKDLSSFSAHMTKMIHFLRQTAPIKKNRAARDAPPALILLDELVTSTDPAEGTALAEALLIEFSRLGMKVVVTTHYNALKMLAHATEGFQNASVEFDVSSLSPTYRLIMGVPGGSSAIDIAGRLGLEERILEQALQFLHRDDRVLEQVLSDLQEKQRRLDEDSELIAELKQKAEEAAREAQEVADRLRRSEREERKGARKRLTEDLLRARADVQAIMDGLKRDRTLIKAKKAKETLADIERGVQERYLLPSETVPLEQLAVGGMVEIKGLGTTGILLESIQGKKRVRVRVGEREMSIVLSQLVGLAERSDQAGASRKKAAVQRDSRFLDQSPGGGVDPTAVLDLRGKTAEEALDLTIVALDKAAMSGMPQLRIIHGHGTGRLKTVLREYLSGSPYVAAFRGGERGEGGDGVTIAQLK